MRVPTATNTTYALSVFLMLLVAVTFFMKTFTPKADIYTALTHAQAFIGIFAILTFYAMSIKNVTHTRLLILFGVFALIVSISDVSSVVRELTDCRTISEDKIRAITICKSASSSNVNSASTISTNCIIASGAASLNLCVVGHITDTDSISTAKAAGSAAAAIAIIEFITVLGMLGLLTAHFWVHSLVMIKYYEQQLVRDVEEAAAWVDHKVFEPTFNALGLSKQKST